MRKAAFTSESFTSGGITPTSSVSHDPQTSAADNKTDKTKAAADTDLVLKMRKELQDRIRDVPDLFSDLYGVPKPRSDGPQKRGPMSVNKPVSGGIFRNLNATVTDEGEEAKVETTTDNLKPTTATKAGADHTISGDGHVRTYGDISQMCIDKIAKKRVGFGHKPLTYHQHVLLDIATMASRLDHLESQSEQAHIERHASGSKDKGNPAKDLSFEEAFSTPCNPLFGPDGQYSRDFKDAGRNHHISFQIGDENDDLIELGSITDLNRRLAALGVPISKHIVMQDSNDKLPPLPKPMLEEMLLEAKTNRSLRGSKHKPWPRSIIDDFATGHPPQTSTHELILEDKLRKIEDDASKTRQNVGVLRGSTEMQFREVNAKLDEMNRTLARIQKVVDGKSTQAPDSDSSSESDSDDSEQWSTGAWQGAPDRLGDHPSRRTGRPRF